MNKSVWMKGTWALLLAALLLTGVTPALAQGSTANATAAKAPAQANDVDNAVDCRVCELADDSQYEYSGADSVPGNMAEDGALGTLTLDGDAQLASYRDGVPVYEVDSDALELRYSFDPEILARAQTEWKVVSDNGRKLDAFELDNKVGAGALILQASLDGEKWFTEWMLTDVFREDSPLSSQSYTINSLQLQNGCCFRVVVAYRMRRQTGESKGLFGRKNQEYEYKKVVELYNFYAVSSEVAHSTLTAEVEPRKLLGSRVRTTKDKGYIGSSTITNDDPHYGWNLGSFIINGYTSETVDSSDSTSVFLKNVGDKVTLWFRLSQDIDRLDNNPDLSIAGDENGYDQTFEIDKTDFGRGALLLRYTDHEGAVHEPVLYTNYLEACARTGADTRVQLFEEGDYEVALDYVISEKRHPVNIAPVQRDYRIYFRFKIRNGNCMVFPIDIANNSELTDGAVTPEGFRLDMAKSRYLNIGVRMSVPVMQADGTLTDDVRFNRPARDGETYTQDGIYKFTVKNKYTGEEVSKTIYVGTDPYVNALSKSGLSIKELNVELSRGAEVTQDGTIVSGLTGKPLYGTGGENQENETGTGKESAGAPDVRLIIAITAGAVLIVAVIIAVVLMRRKRHNAEPKQDKILDDTGDIISDVDERNGERQ